MTNATGPVDQTTKNAVANMVLLAIKHEVNNRNTTDQKHLKFHVIRNEYVHRDLNLGVSVQSDHVKFAERACLMMFTIDAFQNVYHGKIAFTQSSMHELAEKINDEMTRAFR